MIEVFCIGDTHFGHSRPLDTIEEHDAELVRITRMYEEENKLKKEEKLLNIHTEIRSGSG